MKDKLRKLKRKLHWWYSETLFYKYIGSAVAHPKNFIFCLKYPFMKSRNVWSGKFCGYAFTMLNDIPNGWRLAFGMGLVQDIKKALVADNIKKRDWCKKLYWEQIKEKYGTLRLYASTTEKVQNVLSKYEALSEGYCICCGKPARYCTTGWIEYYCEACFDRYINEDIDYKNECRLTKEDIPTYTRFSNGTEETKTALEKYGIDFEELWGLK